MKKTGFGLRASLLGVCAAAILVANGVGRAQEQPLIPVIVKDQSNYFWKVVLAGAEAAGRDLGVKVVGQSAASEQDVAAQIKLLQDGVKDGAAAIVIAPTQYSAPGPAIDEAAKHIPIIVIDSSVASLNMKSTLATDNVAAGRLAADALADAVTGGEVAIVNYLPGAGSLNERSKGFKDQLFAKYPKLTVIDERNGDGSVSSVETAVATIISEHPDLRGIFASNLVTAEVTANALRSGKLTDKIKLIGFDSSDSLVALLADGTITALIVQDPYKMGYDGVKTAVDAAQGRGVLQFLDTGASLITRDNMNGAKQQQLLNPPVN